MTRKVLVVGAAGGVGIEVTRQLLDKGCSVVATVLNAKEEEQLRGAVTQKLEVLTLDLSDSDRVLPTVRGAVKKLDAVAVCAAIGPVGPLETTPLALLRKTFEINTFSNVAVYQACMPMLRASKGRLVFVSSFTGKVALPLVGAYVGSKFALEGLGDSMRREAASFGVKISLVLPGGINTPMIRGQLQATREARAALTPELKALYGAWYDAYVKLFERSMHSGMPPAKVASVVVEAVTADEPQARYIVGDDSVYMCNEVAWMPERQSDEIVAGFMASFD